jgi:hypothetical protein
MLHPLRQRLCTLRFAAGAIENTITAATDNTTAHAIDGILRSLTVAPIFVIFSFLMSSAFHPYKSEADHKYTGFTAA